nr:uncharacterized protein CI109_006405 [Kwoniella shandongensis]KAA5525235.1 hypothetical protein CI109_006405 [Kwoniella shandongensis]
MSSSSHSHSQSPGPEPLEGNGSTSSVDRNSQSQTQAQAQAQAKRTRRRAGPFKRSRTGCGTCKRRGKKCDEEWTAEGFCQRCINGQFECAGRTGGPGPGPGPGPGSSIVKRDSNSTSTSVRDSVGEGSRGHGRGRGRGRSDSGDGMDDRSDPPQAGPGSSTISSNSNLPTQPTSITSSTVNPNTAVTSHAHAHAHPHEHEHTIDPSASSWTNIFSHPSGPPPPSTAAPSIFSSLAVPHPHQTQTTIYDWPSNFHHHHHHNHTLPGTGTGTAQTHTHTNDGNNLPSAYISTNPDGTLALDSTTLSWNTTIANPQTAHDHAINDMWNDLEMSFVTSPHTQLNGNGNSTFNGQHTSGINGNGNGIGGGNIPQLNSNSRVVFLNSEKPTRQGVSLAEIYARVVESWLVGIPSTTRDYARARILALNDNNSVMRNVRYAVSAAYIFLFASDPQDANAVRPKLVEMAHQGAGLIDGQPMTSPSTDDDSVIEGDINNDKTKTTLKTISGKGTVTASKKIRLYVDHVSTPFAADLESTKWTEDAIQELREVIVTDQAQLSDLLWGVIDLQLVEFIRGGAAPSYNMLALGDRLVRSAMGSNHPPISLSALRTSDVFSLRLYALSDISRCIVERGRKTIFNFWPDKSSDDNVRDLSFPLSGDEEPWATYLGLPDSIVILLAEIVNLCAELSSSSSTTFSSSSTSIKAQAEELESALRGWQSQTFTITDSVDSAALVSRTIAGELWRLSALILLYQSVHRVGGLHPVLRKSQKEILSLLDSVSQLPNGDLFGFIALPAFLAATLSITEADRARSIKHLTRPGPERVWLDNIALVEKLWEEVDETGKLPDWHDKMIREGMAVAFF